MNEGGRESLAEPGYIQLGRVAGVKGSGEGHGRVSVAHGQVPLGCCHGCSPRPLLLFYSRGRASLTKFEVTAGGRPNFHN